MEDTSFGMSRIAQRGCAMSLAAAIVTSGAYAHASEPAAPAASTSAKGKSAAAAASTSAKGKSRAPEAPAANKNALAPMRKNGWRETIPTFRWWEYVSTGALLGSSLALRFTVDVSGTPSWKGGILGDEPVYAALLIESPPHFRTWRKIGDIGYFSSFAWSLADPLIAGLSTDWDTAAQMTLMNLEAFGVYSMILSVSQIVVRRERPVTRLCFDPLGGQLGVSCGPGGTNPNVNRSFIGGHAGTVATAATLTCLHHAKLGLWGSPQADALPCVTWTGMTALVVASRTITGQHYLTDNLLGIGVGALSALVPFGLHYALEDDSKAPAPTTAAGPSAMRITSLGFMAVDNGLSLRVGGRL